MSMRESSHERLEFRPAGAVWRDVAVIGAWLRSIVRLRVVALSIGIGLAGWILLRQILAIASTRNDAPPATWAGAPLPSTLTFAIAALAIAVMVACAVMLSRRVGTISPVRTALWIEEHGGTGFALVTWVEQGASSAGDAPSPLDHAVDAASANARRNAHAALATLARRMLVGPLLFVVGAGSVLAAGATSIRRAAATDPDRRAVDAKAAETDGPLLPWRVRITPPAYLKQSTIELSDTNAVRVLGGSRVALIGRDAPPDSVTAQPLAVGDSAIARRLPVSSAPSGGWQTAVTATDGSLAIRAARQRFAKLLVVEGAVDSAPRVVLGLPVRDSVLRAVGGPIMLEADVHDDWGLVTAEFEVVISSGEGERFTVRTERLGTVAAAGARDTRLRTRLDLAALQLGPGDVVHMRAVARDAQPGAGKGLGSSDTRSFRLARPSEYDSVAVEPAPPPDIDKSLLSQRMLLMLTERLEARRLRLDEKVLRTESGTLARDQGRLRQAVGDAVFQRLTGDPSGEHAHSPGDGHDHGVEAVGGKLALSGVNAQGMLEEGDDAPVLAINKPLLEAYNAMWDAGRALEQADTRAAIPFMRVALAAIERARAASRLYLRGRPPIVIVDLAKVRMAGKDTGAPVDRAAREALPSLAASRERRLLAAAALASSDATAARDSLALLRVESLADAPAFAAALIAVLSQFNATGRVDLTASFLAARRVLGGVTRLPPSAWSRGGPP